MSRPVISPSSPRDFTKTQAQAKLPWSPILNLAQESNSVIKTSKATLQGKWEDAALDLCVTCSEISKGKQAYLFNRVKEALAFYHLLEM